LAFGFLLRVLSKNKNNSEKKIFFLFIPYFFLFPFCPSFSICLSSILSPLRLYSVSLPVPFSHSLSDFAKYIYSTCAQLSLSLLIAHSLPSYLSPSNTCFRFLVPTSFFSLFRYSGISSVIHLSYSLLYLDSLILTLLSYLSMFLSPSLSFKFIHLPFFCSYNLSTSSLAYLFRWQYSLSPSYPCSFTFLSRIPFYSILDT
jgi:hypothetical protein